MRFEGMDNPWTVLVDSLRNGEERGEYFLDEDKAVIDRFNDEVKDRKSKDKEEHRVHLELQLPEPFIGDPKANVMILNLNPSYDEEQIEIYQDDKVKKATYNNWIHKPVNSDYPFYPLDPQFKVKINGKKIGIANYWSSAFKNLLEEVKNADYSDEEARKIIAKNIFVVECFPYHSQKGGDHPVVPSQEYSVQLVKEAIKRGAIIVVIRHKNHWEHAVIDLVGYKNRYDYINHQIASLSCDNIVHDINKPNECGFNKIVNAICSKTQPTICKRNKKD